MMLINAYGKFLRAILPALLKAVILVYRDRKASTLVKTQTKETVKTNSASM